MTTDRLKLAMAAGKLAEMRGWNDPLLITRDDLDVQSPVGAPLILLADTPLTVEDAQAVSALIGAGRQVVVVTGEPIDDQVRAWLPLGSVDGDEVPSLSPRKAAKSGGKDVKGKDEPPMSKSQRSEVHRINFKVEAQAVYGSITFLSPKSYMEIRAELVERERAQNEGLDLGWASSVDFEEHTSDCDDDCSDHEDWDAYGNYIFDELRSMNVPCLIDDLAFMGFGLGVDWDQQPNLRVK